MKINNLFLSLYFLLKKDKEKKIYYHNGCYLQ